MYSAKGISRYSVNPARVGVTFGRSDGPEDCAIAIQRDCAIARAKGAMVVHARNIPVLSCSSRSSDQP